MIFSATSCPRAPASQTETNVHFIYSIKLGKKTIKRSSEHTLLTNLISNCQTIGSAIKYESWLCYCVARFSPLMVLETHFNGLFSCSMSKFLTPASMLKTDIGRTEKKLSYANMHTQPARLPKQHQRSSEYNTHNGSVMSFSVLDTITSLYP